MDFGKLVFSGSLALVCSCSSVAEKAVTSEHETFNDYATAICLGTAFDDNAVKADFNKAANGYMERGNMPLEAYEELRVLVNSWLQKDYPSKRGGQVQSAKCFDLRGSGELRALYEQYNPCSSEEGWFSQADYQKACS